MLGSAFEADDAVQDTMLRAWKAAEGFEGRSSLRSWLYRIATNVCLDTMRGEKRRALPMDLGPASPPLESYLRPAPAEDLWVTPIPDARVLPEQQQDPLAMRKDKHRRHAAQPPSHIAMRNDRRTWRTACARAPSSAAMIGAHAPVSPISDHMIRLNRKTPSVDAAKSTADSRATNITSIA